MKTKYTFLRTHVEEYACIEQYLEEMCEKGWMLTQHISLFGSIFCFRRIEPRSRKFRIVFSSCYGNVLKKRNEKEEQDYVVFMKDYGYQYISGDQDMLYFYHEDKHAIDIIEDNEENRKKLRKQIFSNDVIGILLTIFYLLIWPNQAPSHYEWVNLTPGSLIVTFVCSLLIFHFVWRLLHALLYLIIRKPVKSLLWLKMRTGVFLGVVLLGELVSGILLGVMSKAWMSMFVFAQLVFLVSLLTYLKRPRTQPRYAYLLATVLGFGVLLLMGSKYSLSNETTLPKEKIPFLAQQLDGVECKANQKFIAQSDYLVKKEITISQEYYTKKEGHLGDDEYRFSYNITVVKDSFLKDIVLDELLKDAEKQTSTYDFDIYIERANEVKIYNNSFMVSPILLLVKDYKILSLPRDIILNDTNAALFEKAFQIE
ncbi:MAG: DUF2812 domain-containing protein [Longicatena sp.]